MNITNYFRPSGGDKFDGLKFNKPGVSQVSILTATREMNNLEESKEVKKNRLVFPQKIKKDVAHFAWKYGITEVRRYGLCKCPQYESKREMARGYKPKYQDYFRKVQTSDFF